MEVLRDGVGLEGRIWLAGEHAAPFIALGTTTGAYWSGEGVGRRIRNLYEGVVCEEGGGKRGRAER